MSPARLVNKWLVVSSKRCCVMQIKQQCVKAEFMIQEYISFEAPVPTHQTSCNRISVGVLGFNFSPGFQGFRRVLVFWEIFLGLGVFGGFSWILGVWWGVIERKCRVNQLAAAAAAMSGRPRALSTDPLILLLRVAFLKPPLCFCSEQNLISQYLIPQYLIISQYLTNKSSTDPLIFLRVAFLKPPLCY